MNANYLGIFLCIMTIKYLFLFASATILLHCTLNISILLLRLKLLSSCDIRICECALIALLICTSQSLEPNSNFPMNSKNYTQGDIVTNIF